MRVRVSLLWIFLLVSCRVGFAQEKAPVQRKDSATVSAGISKEQLALEAQLAALLSDADEAVRSGRNAEAIKQYETALAMVQKEPLLAEMQEAALRRVANGYLRVNHVSDAIATFQKRIDVMKRDCDSETASRPSDCGDAQRDLAMARMDAGDFEAALESLRQAQTSYENAEKKSEAEKGNGFHEYTMIQVMNQSKIKLLIAVALFRLGKTNDAVAIAKEAVPQLNRVKEDNGLNVGIRESAGSSLKDAQTILQRLGSAQ